MSEPVSNKEFNVDEFIKRLGQEDFSPGHTKDNIDPEIRNRVSALTLRAQLFEAQGKSEKETSDLRIRGTKALLGRFPDQSELVSELISKAQGFEHIIARIEDEERKS